MKNVVLAYFLLGAGILRADSVPLYDRHVLSDPHNFSTHCTINDPGITGRKTLNIYTHGAPTCDELQALYNKAYTQVNTYLLPAKTQTSLAKTLTIWVVTLAEINNPEYFDGVNERCMHNPKCRSGAYFASSFPNGNSSNIDTYLVFDKTITSYPENAPKKYSFFPLIKHELMHVILYKYRQLGMKEYVFDMEKEHELINDFLISKR